MVRKLPAANNILHVDGEMTMENVKALVENSSLDYDPVKMHFFSFASKNRQQEISDEGGGYLANFKSGVSGKVEEKYCDVFIIANLSRTRLVYALNIKRRIAKGNALSLTIKQYLPVNLGNLAGKDTIIYSISLSI